jgi:hypothetical protein
MSKSSVNYTQPPTDESDEQIIERIQPKVSLLLALLLGIFGNFFVNAVFQLFEVPSTNLNVKYSIVVLGIVSGIFCIILLFNDLYPDLARIKNYPKQTTRSKYILWIFIIIVILVGICGIYGIFGPHALSNPPSSSEYCQNVTYVINQYYQNYTVEEIKIEKPNSEFSLQELKYLTNRVNGTTTN